MRCKGELPRKHDSVVAVATAMDTEVKKEKVGRLMHDESEENVCLDLLPRFGIYPDRTGPRV